MSHLSYQYIYFLCVIIWNSKYKHKCILKWNIWNVVFIYSSILLYLSSENICPCASFHIIFIDEINRKWKNFHYHWHVTSTVSFSHIKADTWMRVDFRRTNQDMSKQKSKPINRNKQKARLVTFAASPGQTADEELAAQPGETVRLLLSWKRSKSLSASAWRQHREIKSNEIKLLPLLNFSVWVKTRMVTSQVLCLDCLGQPD